MIGDFINRVLDATRPEPNKRIVGHTIPLSALESFDCSECSYKIGRDDRGHISPDREMMSDQQEELSALHDHERLLKSAIHDLLVSYGPNVAYKKEKFKNTQECEQHVLYDITQAIRAVMTTSEWADYVTMASSYSFKYDRSPDIKPFPNVPDISALLQVQRVSDDAIRICSDEGLTEHLEDILFTPILDLIKAKYAECLLDPTAVSTHDGILFGIMVRV